MSLLGGLLHRMIFWELVKVFLPVAGQPDRAVPDRPGRSSRRPSSGCPCVQMLAVAPAVRPEHAAVHDPGDDAVRVVRRVRPAVARQRGGRHEGGRGGPAHRPPPGRPARADRPPRPRSACTTRSSRAPSSCCSGRSSRTRRRCSTTCSSGTGASRRPKFPYVIYVRDVQGRRLIDVVVKRKEMIRDPQSGNESWTGRYDLVVRAREARLRVALPDGAGPDDKPMLYIDPDRWASVLDGVPSPAWTGTRPVAGAAAGVVQREGPQGQAGEPDLAGAAAARRTSSGPSWPTRSGRSRPTATASAG